MCLLMCCVLEVVYVVVDVTCVSVILIWSEEANEKSCGQKIDNLNFKHTQSSKTHPHTNMLLVLLMKMMVSVIETLALERSRRKADGDLI